MAHSAASAFDRIVLRSSDGLDGVELCRHGAHVLGWHGADGCDRLFLSRRAEFAEGKPIRGGVPIVFPQFGDGPLPKHGLVRDRAWTVGENTADRAALWLEDSAATRTLWPHAFRLDFTVAVATDTLTLAVQLENRGTDACRFKFALHSYFAVGDIALVSVHGLAGCEFRDELASGAVGHETREAIRVTAEVDRVYVNAPDRLRIVDGGHGREFAIRKGNLPDVVLWNPWIDKSRRLPDFMPEEYRRMICLETGAIAAPVTLAPGERWEAKTVIGVQASAGTR